MSDGGVVAPATEAILEALARANPDFGRATLLVYADALRVYEEAAENIRRLGGVVQHPRTGAPIENPYLKVQAQQGRILQKMAGVDASEALKLFTRSSKSD